MEQPAETVDSLDTVPALEALRGRVGDRNLEVDPAVRALVVVVTTNSRSTWSRWRSPRTSTQSRHSALAVRTKRSANAFDSGSARRHSRAPMPKVPLKAWNSLEKTILGRRATGRCSPPGTRPPPWAPPNWAEDLEVAAQHVVGLARRDHPRTEGPGEATNPDQHPQLVRLACPKRDRGIWLPQVELGELARANRFLW